MDECSGDLNIKPPMSDPSQPNDLLTSPQGGASTLKNKQK
jgi:hypothetical protein